MIDTNLQYTCCLISNPCSSILHFHRSLPLTIFQQSLKSYKMLPRKIEKFQIPQISYLHLQGTIPNCQSPSLMKLSGTVEQRKIFDTYFFVSAIVQVKGVKTVPKLGVENILCRIFQKLFGVGKPLNGVIAYF